MAPPAASSAPKARAGPARAAAGKRQRSGRRGRRSTQQPLFGRRSWLRGIALGLGIIVLLAHVFTLKPIGVWLDWLHIDWPDMAKHFSMLALFALVYRLSWEDRLGHEKGLRSFGQSGWSSLLLCSAWGAMCEILQHWIPRRDFSVFELAANVVAPVLVGLLYYLARQTLLHLSSSR